jgi:hypothetical protein
VLPLTLAQVATHEAHILNVATGFEHEATECLVSYLQSKGHLHVQRHCCSFHVPDDGRLLDVDAVVLAADCAILLEAKNSLNEAASTQLQRRLNIIQ